ncbi:hypothetical protein ACIBG7_17655 [Nonomuraea sp. NPDC050328]|uniref:hypothetical protein n=1 Tax=Nonomuraea sp. NPDC050328 TaxID=3364361 RepID=UPI0037975EA2
MAEPGEDAVEKLRGLVRERFGTEIAQLDRMRGGSKKGVYRLTLGTGVLRRARADLGEAAARVERLAAAGDELAAVLGDLADGIEPRAECGLVHGELGPDHVLVDAAGEPVLIDIEGVVPFDVEWEHVFLRIRFGEHYPALAVPGLDERRLRFYRLAQHLSLVAGPLRLLDGDFPDRAFMAGIAEHHTGQALAVLTPGGPSW